MITLKQILNQLLSDVTSDDPGRELSQTAQQLRRATHEALREESRAAGELRGHPDDELTDPDVCLPSAPPEGPIQ